MPSPNGEGIFVWNRRWVEIRQNISVASRARLSRMPLIIILIVLLILFGGCGYYMGPGIGYYGGGGLVLAL
jgi:hypothetical protein